MHLHVPAQQGFDDHKTRGSLLIATSLLTWTLSMTLIWQLATYPFLDRILWSCVGGALGGAIGSLRGRVSHQRTDGWAAIRIVAIVAATGIWMWIFQNAGKSGEFSDQWSHFLVSFAMYNLARDLCQTGLGIAFSTAEARKLEESRSLQRARVHASIVERAKARQGPAEVIRIPFDRF